MKFRRTANSSAAQKSLPVLLLLIAFIVIAAAMRLIDLMSLPPPAWFDEVWYALRTRELVTTGNAPVYYPTNFGGGNMGIVFLSSLPYAMGLNGITTTRWMPALFGIISVPLAYACFRAMQRQESSLPAEWKHYVPLLTALVLSYSVFYVTIGRIGMENGLSPAIALFVIWQISRASQRGEWLGWVLAGIIIGLAQINGLHTRFIVPLMIFVWAQNLFQAESANRRRIATGGFLTGITAIIFALPLILFFIREPQWITGRAGIVSVPMIDGEIVTYPQMVADNARLIARVFFLEGSYDPKNGIPGIPLLDAIQAIGFIVGLGWSLVRFSRHRLARTLLFWLILLSLPSLLTEGAPNLGRMIGIAPPTAALVAIGWVEIYRLAIRATQGREYHRWAIVSAGTILGIVSIGWHAHMLFVQWPKVPNLHQQFTSAPVMLAETFKQRAETEAVFVMRAPEAEDIAAFEYVLPDSTVRRLDFRKCLPLTHYRVTRTTYLILDGRDNTSVERLITLYPDAQVPASSVDLFQESGTLVEIPPDVLAPDFPYKAQAHFEKGIQLFGYDLSTEDVSPGETLFLTLWWLAESDQQTDLTAFTHIGTGFADQTAIIAQRDGIPCDSQYPTSLWQAGDLVPDSFAITIPADASSGTYPIAVGWYVFPSLERISLNMAENPLNDNRAVIGTIEVTSP